MNRPLCDRLVAVGAVEAVGAWVAVLAEPWCRNAVKSRIASRPVPTTGQVLVRYTTS